MKSKNILLGVLAIMLIFTMTVVGCGEDPTDNNNNNNNNNGGEATDSTFTLSGIPAEYNGKYAGLTGTPVPNTNSIMLYGFQNFNASTGIATLSLISNGSVKIPMWYVTESNQNPVKYTGSNNCSFTVLVVNSQTINFPSDVQSIATAFFDSVPFTNGGATRAWNGSGNGGGGGNWTAVADSKFGTSKITTIAYGNNKFVASGYDKKMATSTDGITWTTVTDTPSFNYSITRIDYGNNMFIAAAGGQMATSSDGSTWTIVTEYAPTFYGIWTATAYGNGKFVAVGRIGPKAATSTNGSTWTVVNLESIFGGIDAIAYGNNMFVAGGSRGKMAYSTDGTTWTAVTDSTFDNYSDISAIAYGNNMFVAVSGGQMAISSDGIIWTKVTDTPGYAINCIAYGNNKFIVGGDLGKTSYSTDGTNWTTVTTTAFNYTSGGYTVTGDLNAIAYGNNKFVAGGAQGKMAYLSDN